MSAEVSCLVYAKLLDDESNHDSSGNSSLVEDDAANIDKSKDVACC
jgi:hypothetical protein